MYLTNKILKLNTPLFVTYIIESGKKDYLEGVGKRENTIQKATTENLGQFWIYYLTRLKTLWKEYQKFGRIFFGEDQCNKIGRKVLKRTRPRFRSKNVLL